MNVEPTISLDEAKSIVKTKPYPKVTEESIKAKIDNVDYVVSNITTICLITMTNGFKFVGTSTPASPENFDADVGKRYAYENAFKQIWTHEGYLLREYLSAPQGQAQP